MRYEDASQTGSAGSDVNARDDSEHLAGNDFGPATGNLITGSGTVSGATGTDMAGAGAHITAITGPGGSDTEFDASGKLEVAGQYGTLTIDAEGNYTYVRNPGSPEGVSETFTYTLADATGATDSANLVINIGNLPMLQAQGTQTIQTNNGVVVLPAGVELSDVRVVGRDLVVTLPDGSTMIIPDGAIFVPQLVVNGVEVPASNLAALLIDSEPKPAAGDTSPTSLSSGGNFEVPVAPLDPGVPLGDLIPPTELSFTPPEFEDLFQDETNEAPEIGVSSVNVSEEGVSVIAAPNPDNAGSPDTTNSPTNGGTIPVSDGDGDALTVTLGTPSEGLTSQGVAITWAVSGDGHTLTGSAGGNTVITLVINDSGNYTVTLARPVDHPNAGGEQGTSFVVPVSVSDGEETTTGGTITVTIEDDSPTIVGQIAEPQLVVDDTTLAVNDTDAFSGSVTVSFGADGPAGANALSFALGTPGGASGIIDVATGEAVNLSLVGGVVQGRTATSNLLVFTVSVDGSGNVTLDQLRAVQHNDPTDPIETGASAATLSADNLVTLNIIATDRDGDQASLSVNIGQNLHFEDDGPSISLVSTTEPQLTVDDTTLGTNASASFAGLFAPVFGNDGAATGGGVAYALSIVAGPSGIIDVATGEAVNLVLNGAVVEGRSAVTNQLVFTVSVNGSGVVTLDQIRAVQHNDPTDPDEAGASAATLTLDSLVKLTATVTDKDGDTATASVDIGSNLQFKDDGPSITATGTQPTLVVDETVLATDDTQSFAGAFSPSFGADGPAGTPVTYALGVIAGASGLVDTASGQNVILSLNGGVVEGRTAVGGDLVFTVSVAANGDVTLNQLRAVVHNDPADPDEPGASAATLSGDDLITLSATATDKDGDTATATIGIGQNLQFEDDGPSILASGSQPILIVDETVLTTDDTQSFAGAFIPSFGADGPAATPVTYALGVVAGASGLVDTASGQNVILSLNGAVVEGRTAVGGDLVFTVSVAANGDVTLNQLRAVVHNDPADPDEPGASAATLSSDDLITLTATATDKDGDTATATIGIGQNLQFEDDGPSVIASGVEPILVVDDTTLTTNASASFAGLFIPNYGADGPAAVNAVTYALAINAGDSGIVDVATGEPVFLVGNGSLVEGRTAGGNVLVFTVSVDSSGLVTLNQIRAVQHNDPTDPDEPGASAATLTSDNLIRLVATVTDKDGDTASTSVNIGQNLQFKDDGPTAHNDTDTITGGGTSATGNVISGVGTNEGAANADSSGADSPAHITGISGVSPIDTTFSGGFLDATGVHGTLQIDANGNYTYTRTDNVQGTVQDTFTYTLTDADGDSVTATLIISMTDNAPNAPGNKIVFLDDDTLAGGIANGPGDRTPDTQNTTGTLLATGGDGDIDYFIAAVQNLPTGFTSNLTSLAGVQTLQISQNGTLVITVTLTNESGDYTVTQNAPIVHALDGNTEGEIPVGNILSAINVAVFAQDADGDPSPNGTISISVDDDTPVVTNTGTQPTLVVDETVLATNDTQSFAGAFGVSYGADGPAAVNPTVYTLGVIAGASGLVDTATGQNVILSLNGAVVEGRTAVSNDLVFTVSVAANGNVTLDQLRAVVHNDPADPDEPGASAATLSADNLITLTAAATDKDGDTISASINIGQNLQFEDDGPSAVHAAAITSGLSNGGGDSATANLDGGVGGDSIVANNFGADGAGGVIFTAATITALQGQNLKHGGVALEYTITGGGQLLTGYVDTNNNDTVDGGETVFTIQLQPVGQPNNYVVTMVQSIDTLVTTVFDDLNFDFVGGNGSWAGFTSGTNGDGINDLLLTPMVNGANSSTMNTNANEGGVGSGNSVALGEGVRIDSVSDLQAVPAPTPSGDYGTLGNQNHVFGQHVNVIGLSGLLSTVNGPPGSTTNVNLIARDEAGASDTNDLVGDGAIEAITVVTITHGGITATVLKSGGADQDVVVDGITYNVVFGATDATVNGAVEDTRIGAQTADGYDSLEFRNVGGQEFKIGAFAALSSSNGPLDMPVPISVVDGDGDTVASGNLAIHLDGSTPPVVLDLNGDGVHFLGLDAGVHYDYGAGLVATAWAAADDGILVRDANHNGTVDGASEFVFGGSGQTDMEALHAQYGDQLDASDADFTMFAVWNDANSNGVVDGNEMESLAEAGITSIGLVSDGIAYDVANGDVSVAGTASFTRADGSTGDVADALFATRAAKATQDIERVAANSNTVTLAAAVAAAGVVSTSAAASGPDIQDAQPATARAFGGNHVMAGFDTSEHSVGDASAFTPLHGGGFDLGAQTMATSSHTAIAASHFGELASALSIGSGPGALLEATDISAIMQMPAQSTGMKVAMAAVAESLVPAQAGVNAQVGDNAQGNGTVEQIVADALHGGGHGPDINALLNALPGAGLGDNAGLHGLATQLGHDVPNGDTGHGGVFTFDVATIITTEAMVLHHDAVQPVANG